MKAGCCIFGNFKIDCASSVLIRLATEYHAWPQQAMDAGVRPEMLDVNFDCISCSDLFSGGAVREGWIVEHELYPPFLGSVVKFVRGGFRPCCSYDRLYPKGPFQL